MAQGRIEAHKVTTPIQLLAAWFVALIALDGSFLTAAAVIKSPEWAATALLLAAIVNVPLFLGAAFLLQTKYRPELQGDRFYSDYLKDKRTVDNLSGRVRQAVEETGLTLTDLAHGRSLGEEAQQQMKPIVDELKDALKSLEPRLLPAGEADPSSLYALAQGYLTVGNWLAAGRALEEYAGSRPEDFEANLIPS